MVTRLIAMNAVIVDLTRYRKTLSSDSSSGEKRVEAYVESRGQPGDDPAEPGEIGWSPPGSGRVSTVTLAYGLVVEQCGSELAWSIAVDGYPVGDVGHGAADGADVAGGSQLAVDHGDDPLRHPLDLLEHVRRDDDGSAAVGKLVKQADQVGALDRVCAVEGLVEDEDLRLVDEGGCHLGPLPHALRVPADARSLASPRATVSIASLAACSGCRLRRVGRRRPRTRCR